LQPTEAPTRQKLLLQTLEPVRYTVLVAETNRYPVEPDGQVAIEIPKSRRGCSVYLFGKIKISDGKPKDMGQIEFLKDGAVIREMSPAQLHGIPTNGEGSKTVVLP
jgi:hypothetical protein